MADLSNPRTKKTLRVLSMDGGGVRGVAIARILQEIEKACEKPIHELFDVVIGTSTGGLLSIMMSVPTVKGNIMSAEDAKNFYLDEGTTIFRPHSFWEKVLDWTIHLPRKFTKPKYSPEGLESVIRGHYGDHITLASAKTCVGVVASDIRYAESLVLNSMRAKLFPDDYRHNASIVKVGRATSAAPLFLPPVSVKRPRNSDQRPRTRSVSWKSTEAPEYLRNQIILEDGGTTHNNPAFLGLKLARAYLKAHGYDHNECDYQVVSIGTGTADGTDTDPTLKEEGWKKEYADGGLDNVVRRVFIDDIFGLKVKEYRAHLKVKAKLGNKEGPVPGSNYFRIQFELKKEQLGHMDNSKKENMDALVKAAENYLFKHGVDKPGNYTEAFQSLANFINQECERPVLRDLGLQQPLQDNIDPIENSQISAPVPESITHEKINDLMLVTSLKRKLDKYRSRGAL